MYRCINKYQRLSLNKFCTTFLELNFKNIHNENYITPNNYLYYIIFNVNINMFYKTFLLLPLRHSKNNKLIYICFQLSKLLIKLYPNDNLALRFYKASLLQYEKCDNANCILNYNNFQQTAECNYEYYNKMFNILDTENSIIKKWNYENYNDFYIKFKNLGISIYSINLVKTFESITKKLKIVNNNTVLLSISGGVDSMSLYLLLKIFNFTVHTIFINYCNREECMLELEFLKSFIYKFKSKTEKFYYKNIKSIKRNNKTNFRELYEAVTRDIRFDLYQKILKDTETEFVVLGHNRDDCLENIFTNISKNQKYENLYGMTFNGVENGVKILRPFLDISKKDIYDFANEINMPYLKDSTPKWSNRGKMRDILIPQLEAFDSRIINGMYNLSKYVSITNKYLDKYANSLLFDFITYGEFIIKKNDNNIIKVCNIKEEILKNEQTELYNILNIIFHTICINLKLPYISRKSINNLSNVLLTQSINGNKKYTINSNFYIKYNNYDNNIKYFEIYLNF